MALPLATLRGVARGDSSESLAIKCGCCSGLETDSWSWSRSFWGEHSSWFWSASATCIATSSDCDLFGLLFFVGVFELLDGPVDDVAMVVVIGDGLEEDLIWLASVCEFAFRLTPLNSVT